MTTKKEIISKLIIDSNSAKAIKRMKSQIEAYDYNHQKIVKENNDLKYQIQEQKAIIDTIKKLVNSS